MIALLAWTYALGVVAGAGVWAALLWGATRTARRVTLAGIGWAALGAAAVLAWPPVAACAFWTYLSPPTLERNRLHG